MAFDPLTAFAGTAGGFVAGLISTVLTERAKSGAVGLESELARIDDFSEAVIESLEADPENRRTEVHLANRLRRRVGEALRKMIPDTASYTTAASRLNALTRLIQLAEDGAMLTADSEADASEQARLLKVSLRSTISHTIFIRHLRRW